MPQGLCRISLSSMRQVIGVSLVRDFAGIGIVTVTRRCWAHVYLVVLVLACTILGELTTPTLRSQA